MAKDPAFLFYPGDWLGGTLGMSFEEKGAYLDLLIFQFNRGAFTESQAMMVLRDTKLWQSLKSKFIFSDGLYSNNKLQEEKEKRQKYTESRRQSRLKTNEDNVRIYIVRDNVRLTYKIGSSVNPLRRYNELSNQVAPAIMHDKKGERDITLIWYSDVVQRTEEALLHEKFKDKNITGEWFLLGVGDLDYIFNKYSGTHFERTIERTENENENIISNKINTGSSTLVTDMIKIFKERNPSYPIDADAHYPQVLQIAYRIAKMKGWEQRDVLNGKMNDTLKSWTTIVDFILTDDWLTTRGLIDLNTNKEWDRLILKMTKANQDKVITQKKEFIGSPIKKESDVNWEQYQKR
jgi:hypothetical protein